MTDFDFEPLHPVFLLKIVLKKTSTQSYRWLSFRVSIFRMIDYAFDLLTKIVRRQSSDKCINQFFLG